MKVPEPRRLSSGKWYIYLRLNGHGVSITEASKRDCIAKAQSIKAQYKAGELDIKPPKKDSPENLQLGDVINDYIARYEPVLSPSTIRGYSDIRKNRFQGYMDTPVCDADFQAMINDEIQKVSPKTVKNAWGLVYSSLKESGFSLPNVKLPPVPTKEIPFLQPEEIKPFLKAMEGDIAEIPALLMLHSLRYSEVLGLTWDCIDLSAKKIKIRGAVVYDKKYHRVKKETAKNQTSSRTVDIMIPRLTTLLADVKDKSGPLTSLYVQTSLLHIQAACRRAGVTVVGNHGLRHSFASLAYDLGWSERMIMDVGGWSNPATAHKIYIRIANSRKAESLNSMAAFYSSN